LHAAAATKAAAARSRWQTWENGDLLGDLTRLTNAFSNSEGRTLIEKVEDHAEGGFAVVLLTGDD